MKKIVILLGIFLSIIACKKIEQIPSNIANSNSLTDFGGIKCSVLLSTWFCNANGCNGRF